ncbi:MFS transporter [Acidilobus sp.]|jgi:MFS family permease|uniref:MFS transporter n=1 Tax=Acidilobus sp. TaxID=1872109 RepID=UPI003D08C20D
MTTTSVTLSFLWAAVSVLSLGYDIEGVSLSLRASVSEASVAILLSWEVGAVASVLLGRLADRIGDRPVMVMSSSFLALGLLLAAASRGLSGLYVAWALVGVGANSNNGIAYYVAANLHPSRSGTMIGVLESLYFVGAMIMSGLYAALGASGWRLTFLLLSALNLISAILLALSEFPPRGQGVALRLSGVPAKPLLFSSIIMASYFILTVPLLTYPTYTLSLAGIGGPLASVVISIASAAGIISYVSIGALSDRVGRRLPLAIAGIMGAASGALMLTLTSNKAAFAVAYAVAVAASGFFPAAGAWVTEVFPGGSEGLAVNLSLLLGRVIGGLAPFLVTLPSSGRGLIMAVLVASAILIVSSALAPRAQVAEAKERKT